CLSIMKKERGMSKKRNVMTVLCLCGLICGTAGANPATYRIPVLTPESALTVAQAALESCRKSSYQVAVSVTDRSGTPIVMLRDRFAGPHTVEAATRKAYTAASFRMSSSDLEASTQPGKPTSAIRDLDHVLALGGGLPIEVAGTQAGAVGVSGAPGGDADAACAQAGIDAIAADLEFQ